MSLKDKIFSLLTKRPYKLTELYKEFEDTKPTTIRGRINENVGKLFYRVEQGVYIASNGDYDIIYADPPWSYKKKVGNGCADDHYNTLSLKELKKLPVKDMCKKDAVLFMWATMPMLPDAIKLIESWGFTYKTCAFNWVKQTVTGKIFIGCGHYTRANSEVCLLAVKGKGLQVLNRSISQIIFTQIEKHSKKPGIVYEKIGQLYGDCKRLEMFARNKTPGWDTFGIEA